MSRGRNNKLAAQIGEFLVCAELGRRGLIATPFAGNVPAFDVLAADDLCRTLPIQVKASSNDSWPSRADSWMDLSLERKSQTQVNRGPQLISNPDLIYVCVAIAPPPEDDSTRDPDRFFVLTKAELQTVCIDLYTEAMDRIDWHRPRNWKSFDCRFRIHQIEQFEDNWDLITERLSLADFNDSLDSTEE